MNDLTLSHRLAGNVVVFAFRRASAIEHIHVSTALRELCAYADSRSGINVLLDMSNIECLTSEGLAVLVSLLKKIRSQNSCLKLCSVQPLVADLFEVTCVRQSFDIFADENSALESFQKTNSEDSTTPT